MKYRDLVKKLLEAGFRFYGHGGNHDRYKRGSRIETIPRHREINDNPAKAILRRNGIEDQNVNRIGKE